MRLLQRVFGNPKAADQESDQKCVFCDIIAKTHPDSETVIYEDEDVVVFPDIAPAGKLHLQVVSKRHILNANALRRGDTEDIRLATSMLQIGQKLCDERFPGEPTKFGCHQEPYHSVNHLHMHAFVLPHSPPWAAWKYIRGTTWWLPAEKLIAQLKQEVE